MDKLKVLEYEINTKIINQEDYVSLTDIAKKVNEDEPRFVIQNWMRNKDTIDYLGLWESIYNPNFNRVGFEAVENESGRNRFTMSPTKWINSVNSIGGEVMTSEQLVTYIQQGGKECVSSGRALVNRRE